MFILSVKNDSRKIELLKTRSQIDIDSFTTFFDKPDSLLNELGLSNEYEVEIEEILKKDGLPSLLPFTGSKYRNIIYNYNNNDYFKKISSLDRIIYRTFFRNELLFQDTKNDKFSEGKRIAIYKILSLLKSNDKDYREKLVDLVSNYFKDYYSAFKKFYRYIIEFTKREELIYPEGSDEKKASMLLRMEDIISGKSQNKEMDYNFEDELDSISTNSLSEIDDKVCDLDAFLDMQGISNEEKKRVLDNRIRKI